MVESCQVGARHPEAAGSRGVEGKAGACLVGAEMAARQACLAAWAYPVEGSRQRAVASLGSLAAGACSTISD